MSHYSALVVVPAGTTRDEAEAVVRERLAPYCENDGENADGWWDWFQVGGRQTGRYSGYDPEADLANVRTCWLCHGTGRRDDRQGQAIRRENPAYTCNGCDGKGAAVEWPTKWVAHDGDVFPVANLLLDGFDQPFTVVTPDGAAHMERWDGKDWIKDEDWPTTALALLRPHADAWVAVVDYHS